MYNKCESCSKQILSAEDCRLTTNDGVTIHTYCRSCYSRSKEHTRQVKELHQPKTERFIY